MLFENIERLCQSRGISIAKLERNCDLGNYTIRNWKKSSPSIENAKRVADYFNVTLDELMMDNPKSNQ